MTKTNWKTKLKTVLGKDEFSEVSTNSALPKADKRHLSLVSSAFGSSNLAYSSKNLTDSPEHIQKTELVSSAFGSAYSRDSFKNNDELTDIKTEKLHEVLNRYIEAGVAFDVSADDFLFIDKAQTLKLSDMEFLKINSAAILCQFQQSLLMKHLFSHSPELFEDFAFEIWGREAIILANRPETELRITDKTGFQIYFDAVNQTTRKWFADLLTNK